MVTVTFAVWMFLLRRYNKNILWSAVFVSLMFYPLCNVISYDFSYRACIPGLVIVSIYVMKYFLVDRQSDTPDGKKYHIVLSILFLGAVTPCLSLVSSALHYAFLKKSRLEGIHSFATVYGRSFGAGGEPSNFRNTNPFKSFFFSKIARKNSVIADSDDNRATRKMLSEQPRLQDLTNGTPLNGTVYICRYLNWIYILASEKNISGIH